MITEPYICTKGPRAGELESFTVTGNVWFGDKFGNRWQPYADFEREKLIVLKAQDMHLESCGYRVWLPHIGYTSGQLLGYYCGQHSEDSESSRLIKRAEFLKAVCEREGVEWLPKEKPVEYRACWFCGKPFPCSFHFKGTPTCDDCNVFHPGRDCPMHGDCIMEVGDIQVCMECKKPLNVYTKSEIDQMLKDYVKQQYGKAGPSMT